MSQITQVEGHRARLQLAGLQAAGLAVRVLGRGMGRATWALARFFEPENRVIVDLPEGRLWVYLNDGYWTRLLLPNFRYEPDVDDVLRPLLFDRDAYFLDCGANIGYWSVVASGWLPYGSVTAVEITPWVMERLEANARLNGDRFTCVNAAVWDRDGLILTLESDYKRHAGATVVGRASGNKVVSYSIGTATLDSLTPQHAPDVTRPLVIKLDVEGAEIPALRGARTTFKERRPLLIYEDHGQDSMHRVTEFVMREMGLRVFEASRGALVEIHSPAELSSIKKITSQGYNFFACAEDSDFKPALVGRS